MWRTTRAVLICLALGGCATTSSMMSSLSSIERRQRTAKPAPAVQPAVQEESGSGLGGIWKNFSSTFSSGAQPVSQTPGKPSRKASTKVPRCASSTITAPRKAWPRFPSIRRQPPSRRVSRRTWPSMIVCRYRPERPGCRQAPARCRIFLQHRLRKCWGRPGDDRGHRRGLEGGRRQQPQYAAPQRQAYRHRLRKPARFAAQDLLGARPRRSMHLTFGVRVVAAP